MSFVLPHKLAAAVQITTGMSAVSRVMRI